MIKGTFYSGSNSKSAVCSLRVSSDQAVYLDGVEMPHYTFAELDISPRVGNTARLIRFPNGGSFQTTNNNAVDALIKSLKPQKSWFSAYHWESRLSYIFASIALCVACAWALVAYGIPFASKHAAFAVPEQFSIMLAEGTLEKLDQTYFAPTHLEQDRQSQLDQLFQQSVPKENNFHYRLLFRSSKIIGANAFALPDGTVVMTDELVAIAEHDEQLVSVLLHEIGHVHQRHALRSAIEASGLYALYSWITGDFGATSSLITLIPVILVQSSYSRSLEWEADTYALEQMQRIKMDPRYFSQMMALLEAAHKKASEDDAKAPKEQPQSNPKQDGSQQESANILEFISSHPPSKDRIDRFNQAAEQLGY